MRCGVCNDCGVGKNKTEEEQEVLSKSHFSQYPGIDCLLSSVFSSTFSLHAEIAVEDRRTTRNA